MFRCSSKIPPFSRSLPSGRTVDEAATPAAASDFFAIRCVGFSFASMFKLKRRTGPGAKDAPGPYDSGWRMRKIGQSGLNLRWLTDTTVFRWALTVSIERSRLLDDISDAECPLQAPD